MGDSTNFRTSSKGSPCPVCGRTKDGDCRIGIEKVLCHRGATHHPQDGLNPGDVITGRDGQKWAYTKETSDERCAVFVIDRPRDSGPRQPRAATGSGFKAEASPPPPAGSVRLARLLEPWPDAPPDHQPSDHVFDHGDGRTARLVRDGDGKVFYPNPTQAKAPGTWPHYREAEAIEHGRGGWVIEFEGENCADIARAGGRCGLSHPGHQRKYEHMVERYKRLREAGIRGIVRVNDHDEHGREEGEQTASAAAEAGLHFLMLQAAEVWPGICEKGSIDDAPGTPADRVAAIERAIAKGLARPMVNTAPNDQPQKGNTTSMHGGIQRSKLTKAELQKFVQEHYKLEFNELTRACEINGLPMGTNILLADSFLAQQHGIEVSKQIAQDTFEFVAKANPYNPVARYLQGLRNRTDLRLVSMVEMAAAFAIEPGDELSQMMLAHHLAGAAKRGLDPGHKHDQMLVFQGEQETYKSSSIEALGGRWYDSATRVEDLESKDFLSKLNSTWLFEIDECEHTLQKRTASEFKGFVTRRQDRYVEKYEKASTDHPRRPVLFGTTNTNEFLNDPTGNRRTWLIPIGNRSMNPEWIASNRDSIWATVLTWIEWGLQNFAAKGSTLSLQAAGRAQQAQLSDPWEGPLADHLSRLPNNGWDGISQGELIVRALRTEVSNITRDVQMRVTRIVTATGFRTHGGLISWTQHKRRYGGITPVSGFVPQGGPHADAAAVPTVPTFDGQIGVGRNGVGTDQNPWQDRRLQGVFQPVPTFTQRESREQVEDGPAGAAGGC